jgi:hypothetical protein
MPMQVAAPVDSAPRPKVILVELFTSEGCNSCPPADDLLRQINGTKPAPDQIIIGISEHVTYWNDLGWADPFSSSIYTDRQNAYVSTLGLDGGYTPQMVVNGTEQFTGSDKGALASAIRKEQSQPSPVAVRILSSSFGGNSLIVKFSAVGGASTRGSDIVAVLTDDAAQSSVLRGENAGHVLSHVAVARSLSRVAKVQAEPEQTVHISLPPSIRAAAGHHLILFAQTTGTGRILGADSRPL